MKIRFIFLILLLFSISSVSAQKKYHHVYRLPAKDFKYTASYSANNALLFVDRDSLIGYLQNVVKYSNYDIKFKGRIKVTTDSIIFLSGLHDTTNISSLMEDQGIKNITESFILECVLNKRATILDKRTNKKVARVFVKEMNQKSHKRCTFIGHSFYLPKDKIEFMKRLERIGCGNVRWL
jgi:hypothetical protein